MMTYSKCFLEILSEQNSLTLNSAVLGEVVDILQCGVEDGLGYLLVWLGPQAGEKGVTAKASADGLGNGDGWKAKISEYSPRDFG